MKKVVTIGGGTGSFMLLSGLKEYPIELSAIVSMADDGGSTGVLRDELGVLPPGDVRQCLVALSDESEKLRELMNYRFTEGSLEGHSFGNLLLSALEKIEGSFLAGAKEASKILRIRGTVIPVTETNTSLCVRLADGTVLAGEHEIDTNEEMQKIGIADVYLDPQAIATNEALEKIKEADLIVIGPGDHYSSIVPNLLVQGIPEALRATSAQIVYNVNLVNKAGHTDNFTAERYAAEINHFIGEDRLDYITLNIATPDEHLVELYQEEGETVVVSDKDNHEGRYQVIEANILKQGAGEVQKGADSLGVPRTYIRHDTEKLAEVLMDILNA
jgi:uncharacterized cofD-like protein